MMVSGKLLHYFPGTDLGIENVVMNDTGPMLGVGSPLTTYMVMANLTVANET